MNKLTGVADLFTDNLTTVLSMYNRGEFEFSVPVEPETGRFIHDEKIRRNPSRPDADQKWLTLAEASSQVFQTAIQIAPDVLALRDFANTTVYGNGKIMPWRRYSGFENLLKSVFRARVINYEVLDYFLKPDNRHTQYLIDIAEGLQRKDPIDFIRKRFKQTFRFDGDEKLINAISEEFVLLGLCGVNAIYRFHAPDKTRGCLIYLEAIENFIYQKLPKLKGGHLSLGLLGLAQYLRARLYFDLGQQELALTAALASSDIYARKGLRQGRARQKNRDQYSPVELEEARMIALRRSALSTAMGVGHIQIVSGRITDAVNLLNLSRVALSSNCGEINARYVDLLWAEGFRALHSSSTRELMRAARVLCRSRRAFKRLVAESHLAANSHYVGRSNVELALVYYYAVRGFDAEINKAPLRKQTPLIRRKQRYFKIAIDYCEEALQLSPFRNKGRRKHRLASEAHVVRSRLHLLKEPSPDYKQAIAEAQMALKCAEENPRHQCEAWIALGTAYLQRAEELKDYTQAGYQAEMTELRDKALQSLQNALEAYKENRRLTALCLLRLAQANTLSPDTYPEVKFYLQQYSELASHVEYAFVKEVAAEVESKAHSLDMFCVVARNGWNVEALTDQLEEYMLREFINELAVVIGGEPPDRDRRRRTATLVKKTLITLHTPKGIGPYPSIASFLTSNIEQNLKLSSDKAKAAAKAFAAEFVAKCDLVRNNRRLSGSSPSNASEASATLN